MDNITWYCKPFEDLTNEELYEIFRLRISVFVVEQNCPYQDADGKDLQSLHVQGHLTPSPSPTSLRQSASQRREGEGSLIAYARIVLPGISYKEISIGRVVTSPKARRTGAGKILMEKTMEYIKQKFGNVPIRIGAQAYLQKFYEKFGFVREGAEYLEDGIPHIIMIFNP